MSQRYTKKVIDLFAGAGGFGLGFILAGYKVALSLEIDKWAIDTLSTNNKNGTHIVHNDIRKFRTKNEILALGEIEPDIIIGGPPCQGFSVAGPSNKDPNDPRNTLFIDFAMWVRIFKPKFFVLENVKGLLSRKNGKGEKVIDIILKTFSSLDYSVEIWVLDAVQYGVPQFRERVFLVGNRDHIKLGEPPATHKSKKKKDNNVIGLLPTIPVADAISDLPKLNAGEGNEEQQYGAMPTNTYQAWAREGQEIVYNHVAMKHTKRVVDRFKRIKWGKSGSDVENKYKAQRRNGNGEPSNKVYDMNHRRFVPNRPAYTIPANFYSSFIHPFQHRNITAREAARLQSFPDWFRFMGKPTVVSSKLLDRSGRHDENRLSQYNQIGNAVPPLLAKAIAEHISNFY